MEKRKIKTLGIETSLLGFGCMRFPTLENGEIDEELAEKMLDKAYASGVTYFDTAWPYHNGKSEAFLGKVMKKYDRSTFTLATKLPCWIIKESDDIEKTFNKQLENLQTDHVDFYLLHALNGERFDEMVKLGAIEILEGLKKEGKIRFLGFSFHDKYENFEKILTYRKWDFCQIQYNYYDTDEGPGTRGYELAEKLDVPLVIMEPVRGGELANLAPEVAEGYHAYAPDKSTASWALRWVASKSQIMTVLSGMSTYEQVEDNLKTFGDFKPLSTEEEKIVSTTVETIRARVRNKCTGCRYCIPCPAGVLIPRIFHTWNNYGMFGNKGSVKWVWNTQLKPEERPENCLQCGACEEKCPQHISIREDLVRANEEITALINS